MSGLSLRVGGGVVTVAGIVLTAFHLHNATRFPDGPVVSALELTPTILSVAMVAVGAAMARERLVRRPFVGRALGWAVVGTVALSAFWGWDFADAVGKGVPVANTFAPMLNFATFGALVGLLVGVYDARSIGQRRTSDQINRINDTLRIATQELVSNRERGELERAVCERLTESDPYDAAWIGRYDPEESVVRPSAWSGLDDEYFESLLVTVDETPTGTGAGGRAIKSGEIQSIPDVFDDPTMEPWWETLERHGIESLSVVPLAHGETVYGFISIYADRPNVFDAREREALSELGETIAHAIAAIETHERLAERERELARQNERLEEFAGVVSHDLRNPLNVAEGYLELAREEGDEEYFDRVATALARMDELIEDVLTLARQGAAVSEFRPAPLADVAEEAWTTVDAADATLRTDDGLGVVSCDRSRLRQLLENLFRNSVEHGSTSSRTQSGDSVEHSSTSSRAKPDDSVEHGAAGDRAEGVTVTVRRTADGFAVEDDGPGIPADARETVFDAGYSTNEDGTGFGLNIVRNIAEAHGWEVRVGESEAGGARFEFSGVGIVDAEAAAA